MGTVLIITGVLAAVFAGTAAQSKPYAEIGRTGEWWVARDAD